MAQNGTWADHIAIQATAKLLKHDIWIVTSQEQSTKQGWLMNKIECGEKNEPFLLGHLGEYHYCSLGEI